ncbi:TonB-dependent receptor [Fulvivirga kasyanovii]|uniref:TonB-dependent receptor n=1 Tax=Fulvivirga kasyanovii TaxID=396812 RepID=UPI001C8848F0|nr:carboxypeptidase-like regulatory domain-containing protein [Fulvivirga kasyanovii]
MKAHFFFKILLVVHITFTTYNSYAQSDTIWVESKYNLLLTDLIDQVEEGHSLRFFYKEEWLDGIKLKVDERTNLTALLEGVLPQYGLQVITYKNNWIIVNQPKREEGTENLVSDIPVDFIVGSYEQNLNRKSVELSGYARDGETGEVLTGVQVATEDLRKGGVSDVMGYYSFVLPAGKHLIKLEYLGYEPKEFWVDIRSSGIVDVELYKKTVELKEVTISAVADDANVKGIEAGKEVLSLESIKTLPTFLGEVDPVKTITALPGISAVGEGTAGFNVRGGEAGQNLLMQDGALLFSSSHLFGLVSAFNPDIVRDVVLYKGGGPAMYGGRVSSVLNVNLRNGNDTKYKINGGLGLISSRIVIEGPIIKNKTTFIAGGRVSYVNWLLKKVDNPDLNQSSATFHDVNVKVKHVINKSNVVSVSGYSSADRFKFVSDTTYNWKNKGLSVKWNHIYNKKLLSTLQLSGSKYLNEVFDKEGVGQFEYSSSISTLNAKFDFNYEHSANNKFDFGFHSLVYVFEPGELIPGDNNPNVISKNLDNERSIESAVYLSNELSLTPNLSLVYGARYSMYTLYGATTYAYDEGQPKSVDSIVDTLVYDNDEPVQTYNGIEPRLSLRLLLNSKNSLKLSYYRTIQYVHLISNTTALSPLDFWKSSGPSIRPAVGDQITVGYFRNMHDNVLEVSVEGYYKEVHNIVDYKDGTTILLNDKLEADLLQGFGRSYGIEFLFRKNKGLLTGWLAYTYSRSERLFKSAKYRENRINNGTYFPANYDTPHNLSLVCSYKISRRFSIGGNFTYATGRPITVPVSKFNYDGIPAVLNFSERNQFRIPDYHRLDLSVTLRSGFKKHKAIDGEWVFSIYNAYGRKNPYSVFFTQRGTAYKLSVLGSIFPSITYNFRI